MPVMNKKDMLKYVGMYTIHCILLRLPRIKLRYLNYWTIRLSWFFRRELPYLQTFLMAITFCIFSQTHKGKNLFFTYSITYWYLKSIKNLIKNRLTDISQTFGFISNINFTLCLYNHTIGNQTDCKVAAYHSSRNPR